MSEQLEKLAKCKRITEWVNPWDERLIKVTGLQPPVDANDLRESWRIDRAEVPVLLQTVKRLLVPELLAGRVMPRFDGDFFRYSGDLSGTVSLEFEDKNDWSQCLPTSDQTLVFDRRGVRGNASVALCGRVAGLAVIAMDFYREGDLDFAVQPLKADKLAQIVSG